MSMDQRSEQPPVEPRPEGGRPGTGEIDYASWALVGGGFIVFIGIFLRWFTVSVSIAAFRASASTSGIDDWTGVVALIAALAAMGAGAAAILMSDESIKRAARIAGTIAGAVALVVTVVAFFRAGDIGVEIPGTAEVAAASIAGTAAPGLYVSFLGAVIATVGGALAMRRP
jgi:hypothetical protein